MKQIINVGVTSNDGTGDTLRLSQQKANNNFNDLYDDGGVNITVNNPITATETSLDVALADLNAGSGITTIIEVTYAQLTTHITNSTLEKGQVYLLTDYMTVYTQPVTSATKSSGVTEQLYITATDVNKINNVCRSKLYPQDIVYYEVTGDIGNGKGTEGFTKGKIYRRIDTIRNNDIGTDWRHVKYDRSGTDKLLFEDYTECFNNVIETFFLFNNVVGIGFRNNKAGDGCYSNNFGDNCISNNLGDYCELNTFGDGCYSITFGDYCSLNTFGNACYSITIGNDCYENTFGNGCQSITIGNDCYENTFGNGCYSNTFGNGCQSNTIDNGIYNYTFSDEVQSKDFTGLLTTTNTEKRVYKLQDGDIILSSIDNFGDTIIETL
jgi:hypothetical protein